MKRNEMGMLRGVSEKEKTGAGSSFRTMKKQGWAGNVPRILLANFVLLFVVIFSTPFNFFAESTALAQEPQIKLFAKNFDGANFLIATKSEMQGGGMESFRAYDLVLQNKTTGTQRVISGSPTVLAASFSPDGKWFAYTSSLEKIYVGSVIDPTDIFSVSGYSVGVAWSPDSKLLSYVKREDLNEDESNIWVLDLVARNARQVTRKSRHNSQPLFSPQGDRILFISSRTGLGSLWLVNLRTNSEIQVTNQGLERGRGRPPESFVSLPCCNGGPLWSSSDKLVWTSADGIWALDINTKTAWKIHNEKGKVQWLIEGEEIVIESATGLVRKSLEEQ